MMRLRAKTGANWTFWLALGLALAALMLSTVTSSRAESHFPTTATTVSAQYWIDRSAVPSWVRYPALTLLIPVGTNVQAVSAWSEAGPVPVQLDGPAHLARLTTSASHVLVVAHGEGLEATDLGPASKAVLKDNKAWAYSLTFDDGQYSVYQLGYPELRRYGYRAGVAVIGRWVDLAHVPAQSGYCGRDELLELVGSGWSLFNHSYNHFSSAADITLNEALRTQQVVAASLNGYAPVVFTSPHVSPLWGQIIDDNEILLGLHLLQAYSDIGLRLPSVDQALPADQGVFHIGRDDVKNWVEDSYNYFDQAHGAALSAAPQHSWVSLHGHKVTYEETWPARADWPAVAASSAYLYNTYGPGGSNEVWVAPADEVYAYWVVRSFAQVAREQVALQPAAAAAAAPGVVRLQYGHNGYLSVSDTYIEEAHPTSSHGGAHGLLVGTGPGSRSSALMRFELGDLPADATVERAVLSVYAAGQSNEAGVDLQVAPLTRPWTASQATWRLAASSDPWLGLGATSLDGDRGPMVSSAHVQGGADSVRWYSMDVTALVRGWQDGSATNHGVVIASGGGVYKTCTLIGSRHPDQARHPKLIIEYGYPVRAAEAVEPTPNPTATDAPALAVALPLLFAP